MAYKIVQMVFRGGTLCLMLFGLFFNSEHNDLTSSDHFFMTGVFGSYTIIIFGLLVEAGLQYNSDKFYETFFLSTGIVLNMFCSLLSFAEYNSNPTDASLSINKGMMSISSVAICVFDLILTITVPK